MYLQLEIHTQPLFNVFVNRPQIILIIIDGSSKRVHATPLDIYEANRSANEKEQRAHCCHDKSRPITTAFDNYDTAYLSSDVFNTRIRQLNRKKRGLLYKQLGAQILKKKNQLQCSSREKVAI